MAGGDGAGNLEQALGALPTAGGPVYRGFVHADGQRAAVLASRYQPGVTVFERAFVSASKSPHGYLDSRLDYYIYSENGRNIGIISHVPEEQEVIFPAGSAFTVLDVGYDQQRQRWRVLLRERGLDAPDQQEPAEQSSSIIETLRTFVDEHNANLDRNAVVRLRPDRFGDFPLGLDNEGNPISSL